MSRLLALAIAAAAVASASCANSKTEDAAESASGLKTDSAGGLVVAPSTPYRETAASGPSALVVSLSGDSAPTTAQPNACAAAKPDAASETVFWVDGIREGKPLPRERRYQLTSSACGIEPRIQAVVVGGAVNVFNDAGVHRLLFVRAGTTDTLQTMPFNMAGSIVATDRLTKTPGVVEVICAKHPGERAYIAVFDHPYFGVASSGEKVTLDSVPAGDYQLLTWREGMPAPATVPTKVGTSGQTEVVVR